jgi:hypothetical protein
VEVAEVCYKVLVLHLLILKSREDDLPWRHCCPDSIGKDVLFKEGLGNLPLGWWSALLLCYAGRGVDLPECFLGVVLLVLLDSNTSRLGYYVCLWARTWWLLLCRTRFPWQGVIICATNTSHTKVEWHKIGGQCLSYVVGYGMLLPFLLYVILQLQV